MYKNVLQNDLLFIDMTKVVASSDYMFMTCSYDINLMQKTKFPIAKIHNQKLGVQKRMNKNCLPFTSHKADLET